MEVAELVGGLSRAFRTSRPATSEKNLSPLLPPGLEAIADLADRLDVDRAMRIGLTFARSVVTHRSMLRGVTNTALPHTAFRIISRDSAQPGRDPK